tara:strand:+ start:506 stop:730 length:225 start_codon:yes stop_codon:yes gene_type:complete
MGLKLMRTPEKNEVILTVPPSSEKTLIKMSVDFNSCSTAFVHFKDCPKKVEICRVEAKLKRPKTNEERDAIGNR